MGYESAFAVALSILAMAMSEDCSRDEGNDLEVIYVLARRYRRLFCHPDQRSALCAQNHSQHSGMPHQLKASLNPAKAPEQTTFLALSHSASQSSRLRSIDGCKLVPSNRARSAGV